MADILTFNNSWLRVGSAQVLDSGLPPVAPKTLRFKFYDNTVDPTQWRDVWNIGATWTKLHDGIYDWHYDSAAWSAKYSGSGADRNSNSALSTYRYQSGSAWKNYLTDVDLDIIDSDLTGVTNVCKMFQVANGVHRCSLNNTGSVENWASCFNNTTKGVRLQSLDPLDMSSVDVSKFQSVGAMFSGASSISSPIVLNMPNVTSLRGLFNGTNISTSTLTLNFSSSFTGATAAVLGGNPTFTEVIINSTTGITSAQYFASSRVQKYTWTNWNTAGVNCTGMFSGCSKLREVVLPADAKVTNATSMFRSCALLSNIPSLDLSSCTNTSYMFYNCSALTSAPSLDLSSCTNTSYMFYNCSALTSAPSYDLSAMTNTSYMFAGTALTSVPDYALTAATNTSYMFSNCSALTSMPSITLPAATNTSYMFSGCRNIASGILSMYNYLSTKPVTVTTVTNTFLNCGADTAAAGELATVPTSWGGLYIVSGDIKCTRVPVSTIPSAYEAWTCSNTKSYRTMPFWTDSGPVMVISTATDPVPSDYDGIGMRRNRIYFSVNNLDLTDTARLFITPAFFQNTGSSVETPFSWVVVTPEALGALPAGTVSADMPKTFSYTAVGDIQIHYGAYDSTKTVYFGFLATNVRPLNWQGLTDAYGLLSNYGFIDFTINWIF